MLLHTRRNILIDGYEPFALRCKQFDAVSRPRTYFEYVAAYHLGCAVVRQQRTLENVIVRCLRGDPLRRRYLSHYLFDFIPLSAISTRPWLSNTPKERLNSFLLICNKSCTSSGELSSVSGTNPPFASIIS